MSRFLTSDPEANDITTALDEVLADWSAPVYADLTLEVNNPRAEAAGRQVTPLAPGPAVGIDLGDPPAGRPVWVAGRVPTGGEPLTFRLRARDADVLGESSAVLGPEAVPGLAALFGAHRVRRLEYLIHSGLSGDDLRAELEHLGYDAGVPGATTKVYAENARSAAGEAVRGLLVREALAAGLPSSETAFVAARTEAGRPVGETVVAANALPSGWSEGFAAGGAAFLACALPSPAGMITKGGTASAPRMMKMSAPPPAAATMSMSVGYTSATPVRDMRLDVPAGRHPVGDGAVLYDSTVDESDVAPRAAGRLTSVTIAVRDSSVTAAAVGPALVLLVFVGEPADPRARVRLADVLRQGGRRPLNIRREANQLVRLTLEDPEGRWQGGVPAMEITLGWEG